MTSRVQASSASWKEQYRVADDGARVELTRLAKFAIWCSVISLLFLPQIAINIGEFPASTDLFCYLAFSAYLLGSGFAALEASIAVLWLVIAAVASSRISYSAEPTSWSSLLLLLCLYAPFSVRLVHRDGIEHVATYVQSTFVFLTAIISAIAVLQLFAINVLKAPGIINIAFVLPDEIRGAGTYSFFRESGGIVKANGFFLRESATLSVLTAIGFMLEYHSAQRRILVIILLLAGLLSSVSGSGILIVMVAFLVPTSLRKIPLFLTTLIFLSALLAYGSEIPGLGLWLDRLSEFDSRGSSGYARFVAPLQMLERSIEKGSVAIWLGNGGGSYLRTVAALQLKYEINDPTWAKLIYEYGLAGFCIVTALFACRLYSSRLRPEICNAILYAWISAGSVLKPDFVLLVWMLSMVHKGPKPVFRAAPGVRMQQPG
ncbi:uncharacterized membrane protein (UPF0136 family) [Bradyrhizobium yuanmingense]|uniref:Uncharacterized membrane protein (UPF0136 family) n=1 Tax=Bradyrhizobium yuanmingense TaxID=108015 RepID=A0ABV4GCS7_9BRAD|nr:hypothetical protein [Bradyrhizobium yuanmingense]